jgi:hypothetical protein
MIKMTINVKSKLDWILWKFENLNILFTRDHIKNIHTMEIFQ